ncbi:ImmA/IrrE family metallo-endopeptidase [Mangrovimonas sp. DI 80]|uniref:ImmA/IrrE family metallo-endopeptidase n=1 Tax=Mangrovimonas sp. DI 80 TaxID=1779330 RepID=UPI0009785D1F|nr:ImmA/IrrE family metallo-endopeptidase [Mangrovimonas sp. DI 80]OMP31908.1 hypothetical protein BKM32_02270 [Mangrovimonas sp. DI 80]
MYSYSQIERLAYETLLNFNLLQAPIDLYDLANKLSISIESQFLDNDISGFLLKKDEKTIIGLNKNHPKVRQRFTIAHEIGHFKLHNSDSPLFIDYFYKGSILRPKNVDKIYRRNKNGNNPLMEKQANFFAANLLMPKKLIEKEILELSENLDYDDKLKRLSEKFKVSEIAMDYRLKALGHYDYGF